jgi:hypothetical protein
LEETKYGLIDARDRAYLELRLFSRLWNLSRATERSTKNLKRYLDSEAAKRRSGALTQKRTTPAKP